MTFKHPEPVYQCVGINAYQPCTEQKVVGPDEAMILFFGDTDNGSWHQDTRLPLCYRCAQQVVAERMEASLKVALMPLSLLNQ